jgi:hypothetical protein
MTFPADLAAAMAVGAQALVRSGGGPDPSWGWRRVTRAIAGLSVIGVLVGCQAGPSPALSSQGVMVGGNATQPYVGPSRPVTFGSIMVCGSDRGPVTVDDITLPRATGGLRISGFAIRPSPTTSGGSPIGMVSAPLSSPLLALDSIGAGPAAPCGPNGEGGSEVLVEVTRPGTEDGCGPDGLDVHYRSGGGAEEGVLHVPLALGIGAGEAPCG